MPFSWYHADIPADYSDASAKATRMYELELGDRAALLLRLKFSREEAKLHLRGYVAWDFELNKEPDHLQRVDGLVDRVYDNRGHSGGGFPMLE